MTSVIVLYDCSSYCHLTAELLKQWKKKKKKRLFMNEILKYENGSLYVIDVNILLDYMEKLFPNNLCSR